MTFSSVDLVRLHSGIRGMTPALMHDILRTTKEQSIPLSDLFSMTDTDLKTLFRSMKPEVAHQLTSSSSDGAAKTLEQLQLKGFKLITRFDAEYPRQYAPWIDTLPPLLYVHGDTALLEKPGIGFGGSRDVSTAGLHATDKLAQAVVAQWDYTVISGHAKGVDIIAHQSAVAAKGATILVLPEGALIFRLNEALRSYWAEAKDRIVVMSQFAPNEPWSVRNAMSRNATAICLSKAFFVIEAGDEKGGTWAAGKTALSKEIPLYVLDYPEPSPGAAGNKKLIQKGGIPIPYPSFNDLTLPSLDQTTSANPEQLNLL